MSLDLFKKFVKERPGLEKYVSSGEKSWQDFYNMFSLYGEESSVWDKYLTSNTSINSSSVVTIKDVMNNLKNIDVSGLQDSINSLQKGLNYISDLVKSKEDVVPKRSSYEARPMYKYFDD